MKKILWLIFTCIESIVLFIVIGGLTTAITKNVYADILIEDFKSKGEYQEKESRPSVKFYRIPADNEEPTFQRRGNTVYPGGTGDILISLKSEMEIPFIGDFVSFFAGGHAALVLGNYQDGIGYASDQFTIESSGLVEEDSIANILEKSYWAMGNPYKTVIGLRVKMTEAERKTVIAEAMGYWGDPYNYSFLFDTKNKSYCSDLLSKIFSKIGINLNKDGFTTSIYDILLSNHTYISYYHYYDSKGIKHIYYLG